MGSFCFSCSTALSDMGRGPQGRVWDFTWNNPDISGRELFEILQSQTQYFQFQPEIGEETHQPHFQGYVIFKTRSYLSAIRKLMPKCSARTMRTDTLALDKYTSKEDTRAPGGQVYRSGTWEYICKEGGGKQLSNKLKLMLTGIISKQVTSKEAFADDPDLLARNYRGIPYAIATLGAGRPRLGWPVDNILFYGPPGSGKSDFALFTSFELPEFRHSSSGKEVWFDGYQNEEKAVFEDFKGGLSGWKKDLFCAVADKLPTRVPIKGHFVPWNTKHNYFTSNIHPRQWWSYASEDLFFEIERRFSKLYLWRGLRDGPYVVESGSEAWISFWKGPHLSSPITRNGQVVDRVTSGYQPTYQEIADGQQSVVQRSIDDYVILGDQAVEGDRWAFWTGWEACVKLDYSEWQKKCQEMDKIAVENAKEKKVIQTEENKKEALTRAALEKEMNERPHITLNVDTVVIGQPQGQKRARDDDPLDLDEGEMVRNIKRARFEEEFPDGRLHSSQQSWDGSITPFPIGDASED